LLIFPDFETIQPKANGASVSGRAVLSLQIFSATFAAKFTP